MASIDANRGKKSWESLANALERMLKKDKYSAFADIVYYEMAQLAIRNQAVSKANQWLITSIQKKATQAINYFARKKDGKRNIPHHSRASG